MDDDAPYSTEFCARRLKAIGDRTRWAILMLLLRESKTAGDLHAALDIDQTLLSHHLRILKEEGLITGERAGKNIRYSLAPGVGRIPPGSGVNLGCCCITLNNGTDPVS